MKKTLIVTALISLVLLAVPALAAIETPTVSFTTTQLTTGSSRTVSVTVTGSGSSATISRLNLKEVSGLEVSDPSTGQYTNFVASTSGTTKNFVVTSGAAGTYEITAYALESGSASAQQSVAQYLTFVDPSELTVTVTSDPSGTKTSGQVYTLTLTVSNPLDSTVSSFYNLTYDSGVTSKSSGNANNGTLTLAASGTTTLTWNLSSTASDATISFKLGDDTPWSGSITISAEEEVTTTPTGGGAGVTAAALPKESKSWSKVTPGAAVKMTIVSKDIGVKEISIEVKNQANNVKITVEKLAGKPATVTKAVSGKIFQYMSIAHTNLGETNIEKATITVKVNTSWVSDNNIDKDTVALYRYAGGEWNKLNTSLKSEDDTYYYYDAETPGFSYFVVAGEEKAVVQICTPGAKQCVGNDLQQCNPEGTAWTTLETCTYGCDATTLTCKAAPEEAPAAPPEEAPAAPPTAPAPTIPDYVWYVFAIIIVVLIVGGVAYSRRS